MFKRVMMGFAAFGVLAFLATEASAACTWVKTSTGTYRLYGTCSVVCDLALQGGGTNSSVNCRVSFPTGTPILFLCSNGGGNIAPGGNTQSNGDFFFDTTVTGETSRRTGITSAVIHVDLVTPNPNRDCSLEPNSLACQLDQACKTAFNDNWFAVNAVPCASTNFASLLSGGSTETYQDSCKLEVTQCDPGGTLGYTDVLGFNKKTGEFEKTLYQCTETGHFRTN